MKFGKVISLIGIIAMTLIIGNAFINGNFSRDGGELLRNPWGIVSLVDLYVGFVLFSLWIGFREKSILVASLWIVLMMVLGFFTGSLYVLVNLYQSKGDWLKFFLGSRKDDLIP